MADVVSLLIDGREFTHFTELELTLGVDTYSTLHAWAPFESDRKEFREAFRPFSFKPLEAFIDGAPLFTGTMLTPVPRIDENSKTVEIPGYGKPAVLADCSAPGSAVPVNFQKVNLRTISDQLTAPFGLSTVFEADAGAAFDKVKLDIEENLQSFLSNLARQRNLVMNDTRDGKLRYWRGVASGNPVARFEQGQPPLRITEPTFSPQEYYSEITGFAPAKKKKGAGAKHTEKNPFLATPLRPRTFKFEDTEKGDAPEATKGAMGRMFANIVSWEIQGIPTWRDPSGNLWEPNTTVTLRAPDAMINEAFEFVIRNVKLSKNAESKTATLQVVLPGSFSGEIPKALPWD